MVKQKHEFCTLCIKWPAHCTATCGMIKRVIVAEHKAEAFDRIKRLANEVPIIG